MMMPTTSAAPEKRMPSARISRSIVPGMAAMTRAPMVGRNTARVTAHFSQPLIPLPLSEDRDAYRKEHDPAEQSDRIPLDVPGLDVLQEPARPPGAERNPVDGPVHGPAVHRVDPQTDLSDHPRRPIDEPVEDPLVRPVHAGREAVLDRPDDAPQVQVIEVVLPLQERVAGTELAEGVAFAPPRIQAVSDGDPGEGAEDGDRCEPVVGRLVNGGTEADPIEEGARWAQEPRDHGERGQDHQGYRHRRRRLVRVGRTSVFA